MGLEALVSYKYLVDGEVRSVEAAEAARVWTDPAPVRCVAEDTV